MTQDRVQDLEGRQGEFPAVVKRLLRQLGFNESPKPPPALPSAAAARPRTERGPEPRRVLQPWGWHRQQGKTGALQPAHPAQQQVSQRKGLAQADRRGAALQQRGPSQWALSGGIQNAHSP